MTEQKSERKILDEISRQVSPEVAEAILRAGYQTLLGNDLAEKGMRHQTADGIKNLRQCFGLSGTEHQTSEIRGLEEKLIYEAGKKFVEGKKIGAVILLNKATDRYPYVPKELVREEFLGVLKSIREKSSESALESIGYGEKGHPAKDSLSQKIEYLGEVNGLCFNDAPISLEDVQKEIQGTQDTLAGKIFRVVHLVPTLGGWRNTNEFTRQGVEYALELSEVTYVPIQPETMQKAFAQILETEGMNSLKRFAEKTGIKPSRQIFEKYFNGE